MKSTTIWTALWLGLSASAAASECRLHVSGLRYPPLAAQARIQGVVQVNAVLLGGRLASKPSATGHPLLAAVAEQAVERAEWTHCEDGEQSLRVEFQLVDPCLPRLLAVEQTGPASFRIAMSQPDPCVFTM